jgi:hypothetical protein
MKLSVTITLQTAWDKQPISVMVGEEVVGGGWGDDIERMHIAKALQDFTHDARKRALGQLDRLYDAAHVVVESDDD